MGLEDAFSHFTRRDWQREPARGRIRLAVIGVGSFARQRALPAIADSTYCETSVLVARSPGRVSDVVEKYGANHVVSYDGFLAGDHVDAYDAIYIAAPNAFHGRYATTAAEYGKHVLCEKPLEITVDRARTVVDACADAGVTLMTAYRLQTEPTVRRTRELVREDVIGDVVQVHGGFSHPLLTDSGPDTWRLDPDIAGGGALVDLGIYPLNTIRFVLDSEPTGVYATTRSEDSPFANVDEHVAFQLDYETDVTASCTASFDAHASSALEFVGTEGMIDIESPFGGVVPQEMTIESGDMRMEYTGPRIDEVREEFDYFGYCVLTGTDPEPDGEDGVMDLRTVEAAYESAETGYRVDLE
ncbi:D-xylose 1-dehydrogenase Gfo6 [Natrinema gelatinilyticum]|uniref:D-xylose 1-dehydrogenase Gfo6 n=1 Tax=Natrinema gelatinilyticum TaxID=2961571 RepID=UPI0020C4BA5E|nr:D-xylose 1-dehydrogenase Gfo6 [Natrinema gelatinilyticum]